MMAHQSPNSLDSGPPLNPSPKGPEKHPQVVPTLNFTGSECRLKETAVTQVLGLSGPAPCRLLLPISLLTYTQGPLDEGQGFSIQQRADTHPFLKGFHPSQSEGWDLTWGGVGEREVSE